jgi:uncharacterized protein with von Willebrand factor type A (vWA) domain
MMLTTNLLHFMLTMMVLRPSAAFLQARSFTTTSRKMSPSFIQGMRTAQLRSSSSDYRNTVGELGAALEKVYQNLQDVEAIATRLQQLENEDPHVGDVTEGQILKQAAAEMKSAYEVHGAKSPEFAKAVKQARSVEENGKGPVELTKDRYSASSITHHHDYNNILDRELLVESIDAVERILALREFVRLENGRLATQQSSVPK